MRRDGRRFSDGKAHKIDPRRISGEPPLDSDGDGMPDPWEKDRGLNPRHPSDDPKDRDGYANLEEYLDQVAEELEPTSTAEPTRRIGK